MKVGRNAPCPCGSGKKYKHCCLPKEQALSLQAAREDRDAERLRRKLVEKMGAATGGEWVTQALLEFYGDMKMDGLNEDMVEEAMDWVVFGYRDPAGGTTLCEYLLTVLDLTDAEQKLAGGWSEAVPGFFVVTRVAGKTAYLERIPDRRPFSVQRGSTVLAPGEVVVAWLLPTGESLVFGYGVYALPREVEGPLRHLVQVELELLRRREPGAGWDRLYRFWWPRLMEAVRRADYYRDAVEVVEIPPGPAVRGDGGPPRDAEAGWLQVAAELEDTLRAHEEPAPEVEGALRLWWDAARALRPRVRKPSTWAAAVWYLFAGEVVEREDITREQVAAVFGISSNALDQKAREIRRVLHLQELDPRYVDFLDPLVRDLWWSAWQVAMDAQLAAAREGAGTDGPAGLAAMAGDGGDDERDDERDADAESLPPLLDQERAQRLIDEAWEATGPRRVKLAQTALTFWPYSADAYVILGNEALDRNDLEGARRLYEAALSTGERELGAAFIEEHAGYLWEILRARPYMRARFNLALCLYRSGEAEEAVGHLEELLRLHPDDDQGARYLLTACLLALGDDRRLGQHLQQHRQDLAADIRYTWALWQYRQEGATPAAAAALKEALEMNPHVPAFLLGERPLPQQHPAHAVLGDESEAADYALTYGFAWRQTPRALDWLRSGAR